MNIIEAMQYFLEQKISTTADNYVASSTSSDPQFELDGIIYRQWAHVRGDGAVGDAWTAETTIDAKSFGEAATLFHDKLVRAVPIISLISQCYMEFKRQPLLTRRVDSDIAHINYIHEGEHVGLMFMDNQYIGLKQLFVNQSIRPEFYKYWNDAQNTIGYSPKLLLMFSALEALVKKPNGDKDFAMLEDILGTELKEKTFTQQTGLRHRLIHGEYFDPADGGRNYVEEVHRKVVAYFNKLMGGGDVISEDTVHPQRHFYDNKFIGQFFITPIDPTTPLRLREVVTDFEENDHHATKYEYVWDAALIDDY